MASDQPDWQTAQLLEEPQTVGTVGVHGQTVEEGVVSLQGNSDAGQPSQQPVTPS